MNINTDEWDDLQPAPKAAAATAPVRFSLKQGRGGAWRATVLIRKEVLEKLRLTHWRFAVRIGKGGNRHRLAIVPATDGRFELQGVGKAKGGGVYKLFLPPVDSWAEVEMETMAVTHSVADFRGSQKALFIDLPKPVWDAAAALAVRRAREG